MNNKLDNLKEMDKFPEIYNPFSKTGLGEINNLNRLISITEIEFVTKKKKKILVNQSP